MIGKEEGEANLFQSFVIAEVTTPTWEPILCEYLRLQSLAEFHPVVGSCEEGREGKIGRNSRWREGLKKSEERRCESSEWLINVKSRDSDDVGRLPG